MFLFLLLNAVLFLRPSELVSALRGLPLYQITILACIATAAPAIVQRMEFRSIRFNPITGCVLLLLIAVPLSHISHLSGVSLYYGRMAFSDFGKVVLYYLVAVCVLNSEYRLESFFRWLMILITIVACLSLGHDRGFFTLPELESLERSEVFESGDSTQITQLRGTGIFNDPNDLAMILVIGCVLAVHVMASPNAGTASMIALPALCICILGVYETKSRGGILAFLSAACVLSYARWGMTRALLVGAAALSVAAAVFAMRAGGAGTESGTAQHRIQLWSEGLGELRGSPLFGIGYNEFAKEMGLVAHNSFVHCFTELGLFGGTFFLGAFLVGLVSLLRLWRLPPEEIPDSSRQRVVTVAACLVGAGVAMLSLSRCYVVPTYLILALGAAVAANEQERLDGEEIETVLPVFDWGLVQRLGVASFGFLFCTYVFVRLTARWG